MHDFLSLALELNYTEIIARLTLKVKSHFRGGKCVFLR